MKIPFFSSSEELPRPHHVEPADMSFVAGSQLGHGSRPPSLPCSGPGLGARHNSLAIDVFDFPEAVVVYADAPGLTPGDIVIETDGSSVTIMTSGAAHTIRAGGRPLRLDRAPPCRLWCSFQLPDNVALERIVADLEHGLLRLTMPKVNVAPPPPLRRINVAYASASSVSSVSSAAAFALTAAASMPPPPPRHALEPLVRLSLQEGSQGNISSGGPSSAAISPAAAFFRTGAGLVLSPSASLSRRQSVGSGTIPPALMGGFSAASGADPEAADLVACVSGSETAAQLVADSDASLAAQLQADSEASLAATRVADLADLVACVSGSETAAQLVADSEHSLGARMDDVDLAGRLQTVEV